MPTNSQSAVTPASKLAIQEKKLSSNAKQILKEIAEQQRTEQMHELSLQDYFEIFTAEQITKDYSLTFEELESGIVDGEHDGGVDSVFTFVNGDLIREDSEISSYKKNVIVNLVIIQSKTSGGFSEDPLNKLMSSLTNLLDLSIDYENLTQYNDQVKTAFDTFRGTYRTLAARFPSLEISIDYAAMNADSKIHANITKKMEQLEALLQGMFEEARIRISLHGARELLSLARQRPNETFELRYAKSLSGENGYVLLAKVSDLNAFIRDENGLVRHDLFESNVRDYQGSTEVNQEISATLQSNDSVDFWWLNNGITILASNATLIGSAIKIENPQIVNGLQTSSQIAKFFDAGGRDDKRSVMVKIVSSEDEAVRDKIIKSTNSQNAVPRASLRATDKVQRDIEHVLKAGGYFYDRRKNYYKNQGRPAKKIVSIPLLAQALMTLLRGEPDNARARPSSLIKENDVYNSLFSEDYPIDTYLVAADLIRRIEIALKARTEFEARDRNNLRFYCLFWVACWCAKSTKLTADKISRLKGKVSDADIEQSIDTVAKHFKAAGATDQAAKGAEFKKTIIQELESELQAHYTSNA